jgi:hypothetical protein
MIFGIDPVTTHIGAGTLGAAALYAWVKAGPLLIAKLSGKPNGNGNADLKLEIALSPITASQVRMEAALGRMETTLSSMNNALINVVANSNRHRGGD